MNYQGPGFQGERGQGVQKRGSAVREQDGTNYAKRRDASINDGMATPRPRLALGTTQSWSAMGMRHLGWPGAAC